jgi:hypothetical protein
MSMPQLQNRGLSGRAWVGADVDGLCGGATGKRLDGPRHILAHAPLGRPALCQPANVPLSHWPVMHYVSERPPDPLTFVVFPAPGDGMQDL